jgi:hypothetical protein
MEKLDLMQSITQTHKPTWTDCRQLLLTLFNTEKQCLITLAALTWLEDHAPVSTLHAQAYTQGQFPEEDPMGTLMMTSVTSSLNGIRRHY